MYSSYIQLLEDVYANGELVSPSSASLNRSFETKELNNVQVKIDPFKQLLIDDNEVKYYGKELQWYFDTYEHPKHAPIELNHDAWTENYVPKRDTFASDLKQMSIDLIGCCNRCGPNSNYGEICLRLKNHIGVTQKDWVIQKLKKDPYTRQAIAFYNSPQYQYWSNNDFVCCLAQLFSIKNSKLDTVVYSRSNDLVNSFRFDMIWWRIFQKIIYDELHADIPELQLGSMVVNIFSAHYYVKDEKKLQSIVECNKNDCFKGVGGYL